uniref:Alpha-1,3-glucosyltransferase n=1 Tax=Craspedostauros australis TaxID=1486917 RepID=A0A7S0F5R9_9STRA
MRATVLVLDLIIYGYALWISLDRHRHGYRGEYGEQQHQKHHPRHHAQQQQKENQERWQTRLTSTSMWLLLLALVQPAIVLIDHGHFQYNTVALGWSLMAFHFMTKGNFRQCVVGAFFFCLALNFKQMTLYYAPVVFAYLLGRCFADTTRFTVRFASLGITVITTFLVMWLPFLINGPSHVQTSVPERAVQILTRIFPFQRGLFESKVANLWCALSTKPFSIRERIAAEMQPLLALGLTTVLMLPSCVALFRMGAAKTTSDLQRQRKDATSLLWGATSCSLAFFLASFQVHEKSILMALAPASLLMDLDASFVQFLSVACAWSLWPLLQVDRLEVAYVCTVLIYICVVWMYHQQQDGAASEMQRSFFSSFFRSIPILAYIGMLGLHAMQLCVEAPQGLPDLYPVLWSIAGCGLFLVAWLCTLWHLFTKQAAAKQKVS